MKSQYETYSQWGARTFCDNASRRGTGVSISPQCYDGRREYECTVFYDEHGIDSDTMTLCPECKDRLRKSARKHGYRFRSTQLKEE